MRLVKDCRRWNWHPVRLKTTKATSAEELDPCADPTRPDPTRPLLLRDEDLSLSQTVDTVQMHEVISWLHERTLVNFYLTRHDLLFFFPPFPKATKKRVGGHARCDSTLIGALQAAPDSSIN